MIFSIGLSIFNFIHGCSQDKKLEDFNYLTKALEYRPFLKVVDVPEISQFQLYIEKIVRVRIWTIFKKFYDPSDNIKKIIDVPSILTIHAKLNVINEGKSVANVCAILWTDALSGSDEIRKLLLDKRLRENRFNVSLFADYFKLKEVQPGDTTDFKISHRVVSQEEEEEEGKEKGKFTMHFLFLYENEAGVLYDSYYWARYTITPMIFKTRYGIVDGNLNVVGLEYDQAQAVEFLKVSDTNTTSRIYSKIETDDVLGFLERCCKKDNN